MAEESEVKGEALSYGRGRGSVLKLTLMRSNTVDGGKTTDGQ